MSFQYVKILESIQYNQLFDLIEEFKKDNGLQDNDIRFIYSTPDNKMKTNFVRFRKEENMQEFQKLVNCVLVKNLADMNNEIPGHLFLNNLPQTLTTDELYEIFSVFGDLTLCKIIFTGTDANYGFLNYENKNQSDAAIAAMNGKEIQGAHIFINYHISKKDRLFELFQTFKNSKNLIVKNLYPLTETHIKSLFESYGEFSIQIKGRFGFLNFEYSVDANNALSLNDFLVNGRRIHVNKAYKRNEMIKYNNLFNHFNKSNIVHISNLRNIGIPEFLQIFGKFGSIRSFQMGTTGSIIEFWNLFDALNCMVVMNGYVLYGAPLNVSNAISCYT